MAIGGSFKRKIKHSSVQAHKDPVSLSSPRGVRPSVCGTIHRRFVSVRHLNPIDLIVFIGAVKEACAQRVVNTPHKEGAYFCNVEADDPCC